MKKIICTLFLLLFSIVSNAQIDTVNIIENAEYLFPSIPVKSSYTSLFDKRNGFNYVYSANMESGLGIYDVSIPSSINLSINLDINTFNNLGVSSIEQKGNSLFVGLGDFQVNNNSSSGLVILDISNPLIPLVKDMWDSTIFTNGISHLLIEDNYAYLSTMKSGIIILDISDENNIVYKSHLQLDLNFPAPSGNAHNARGLKMKNDSLYVCFDRGGLRVVDVSDKTNPIEVYKYINTTLNSQAAAAYNDIVLKGNYAFISVDYCGLEILDVSSIPFSTVQWYNPWGCSGTNWSGANIHTNEVMLANNDSLLFVSAGQSELFVFDVTNPENSLKIGEYGNLEDSLATHGLDVWNGKIILSYIHTPFHIPPFTPFYADPGGLKLLNYQAQKGLSSINDLSREISDIVVYPNPLTGSEIVVQSTFEIAEIYLTNVFGQQIFETKEIYSQVYSIQEANLNSGIYFLTIISKKGKATNKIIIKN